jgi:anti-sigma regulatory factor (Ser/Thr protein kinase)
VGTVGPGAERLNSHSTVDLEEGHVVCFYDAVDELVGVVAGYLSAAVLDGDTVVIIATPDHRAAFSESLEACGVDVASAETEGRLLILDAAATLAQFMRGDQPDPAAFEASVGELVRSAARPDRRIRAYGEMVAVLWAERQTDAAIELEKLWNHLAEQTSFALFCGYPTELVQGETGGFTDVCGQHSAVIRSAPVVPGDAVRRFPESVESVHLARRFTAEMLDEWDQPAARYEALCIVTELATNAVVHGRSDFTVSLSRQPTGITIAVADSSTTRPSPRPPVLTDEGGRGLHIITGLAGGWDCGPAGHGKVISVDVETARGELVAD